MFRIQFALVNEITRLLHAMRARLAPVGVVKREQLRERAGEDVLQGIGRGEIPQPPIGALRGFLPMECEQGRVLFEGPPGPQH